MPLTAGSAHDPIAAAQFRISDRPPAITAAAVPTSLRDLLAQFDEAPPDLIAARALQQRVDRKYMFPKRLVGAVLERLAADYQVVRSADTLIARYETTYFDTADRRLFDDHRRGRRPRYKIRLRHHCDRRLTFVEVKQKGACTSKSRLELPFAGSTAAVPASAPAWTNALSPRACRFVDEHCPVQAEHLRPTIWVTFSRLTLVGERINERVTFDWNIAYGDRHASERLREVVVVEVKQPRPVDTSAAIRTLSRLHRGEQTLSKYCLATMRLASRRADRWKPCLQTASEMTL